MSEINLNEMQVHGLATIGEALMRLGEGVTMFARGSYLAQESTREDLRDHYSQESRDARQYPVLTFVANTDVVSWAKAKEVALDNGYTAMGLGGFFTGPTALLAYLDDEKTYVHITQAGKQRIKEIEERRPTAA